MGELVEQFRGVLQGPVFGPEDEGFAAEVAGFNLAAQHQPEVAVGITSEADAAAVVPAAVRRSACSRPATARRGPSRAVSWSRRPGCRR